MILESGKIEIASLNNGKIQSEQSFQTNSEQFIKTQWTKNDQSKFLTSDSQDNLYMWDIAKGITPFFSIQSKFGTILEISQFINRPETVLAITDKNNLQMLLEKL